MKLFIFLLTFTSLFCFNDNYAQDAIHVKTQGQGQSLLVLPGFANSSDVWEDTIEHLKGDYEIHHIDYAGFNGLDPIETPWLPKVRQALKNYILENDLKTSSL